MDEVNKIRKAYFSNGEETKNAISKRFKRSWNTIATIVNSTRSLCSTAYCSYSGRSGGSCAPLISDVLRGMIFSVVDEIV